jgi:hypothetical protein
MQTVKFDLDQNAISFAEEAIKNAVSAESDTSRWKFAILFIVQSIELSLKSALQNEHPSLIWDNIDKPEKKTVTLELAAARLDTICKVKISSEDRLTIATASKIRNQIIHYQINAEARQLKLMFSKLISFLEVFHAENLDEALHHKVNRELWFEVMKIVAHGQEVFKRAKVQMENDNIIFFHTCPKCGCEALSACEPMQDTCYVCGWIEETQICDSCQEVLVWPNFFEHGNKVYCQSCLEYQESIEY